MFKWILVLVAVVAIAVSTGVGAKAWHAIDQKVGMRSLQSRIEDNLRDLKESRKAVYKQLYDLRSQAAAEKAAITRYLAESEKLDAACKRLAPKINEVITLTSVTETSGTGTSGTGTSGTGTSGTELISWGPHTMSRSQATKLLTDWGQSVDRLKQKIGVSQRKISGFEKAVSALEGDGTQFSDSIEKLEDKLEELLTAREVLQVQHQVAEILATVSGRNVPGETAELFGELQSENDRLKAEIEAYGFSAANEAMIGPEDDLSGNSTSKILERYGVGTDVTDAVTDF